MSETGKTLQLKVYVMAYGVKKRCRKTSREMLNLGYFTLDVDRLALFEKGEEKVRAEMKLCHRATIHFDMVTLSTERGFLCESWLMFDPRHEKQILIAG